MLEVFEHVEQGSDEWRLLRAGIPTSSVFADILAKPREVGKGMRIKLLRTLAGERITGEPAESYSNGYMERGKRLESEARACYAMLHDEEVKPIGFLRDDRKGCSPDSLVGSEGGLEIKTVTAAIMLEILRRDTPPPEHNAQVQGNLWISGRSFWDLMIYSGPKLPPRIFRCRPDKTFISHLSSEVGKFNADIDEEVEFVRRYGQDGIRTSEH